MSQQMSATSPIAEQKEDRQRSRSGWPVITGLLLLSTLPVLGGVLRLGEVSVVPGGALSPEAWVPIVAHIVAMSLYCLLGAFQFSPALRTRRGWHRTAGRVLIPAGIVAALSAVWLAVFFGGPADELALAMVRLVFAVAMALFLVLGAASIKRRDFVAHGAWMMRAYSIAVSGGTQALVFALWTLNIGEVDASGETWLVAVGFVINSVAAELLILRRAGRRKSGVPVRGALVS